MFLPRRFRSGWWWCEKRSSILYAWTNGIEIQTRQAHRARELPRSSVEVHRLGRSVATQGSDHFASVLLGLKQRRVGWPGHHEGVQGGCDGWLAYCSGLAPVRGEPTDHAGKSGLGSRSGGVPAALSCFHSALFTCQGHANRRREVPDLHLKSFPNPPYVCTIATFLVCTACEWNFEVPLLETSTGR